LPQERVGSLHCGTDTTHRAQNSGVGFNQILGENAWQRLTKAYVLFAIVSRGEVSTRIGCLV